MKSRTFSNELRRSIRSHGLGLPKSTLTDRRLIQHVVGTGGDEAGFLHGGFVVSVGLRAALAVVNKRITNFFRILDFGCGSGRVLRWFSDAQPRSRFYGCDINADAVKWAQSNAPFATVFQNPHVPPLPYPDAFFDLVFGISVLTHLTEELHLKWLREFARIVKPGGLVLLTVHGEDKASKDLSEEQYQSFVSTGFYYKNASNDPSSTEGLPEFYQVAFHDSHYISRQWGESFEILGRLRHGCMYTQDLIILRKSNLRKNTVVTFADLPIAMLESPMMNESAEEVLQIRGWGFYPDGRTAELDVRIDSKVVGKVTCTQPRPDVALAFYTNQNAAYSGFKSKAPLPAFRPGSHVVWLSPSEGPPLPVCAASFQIPGQAIDHVRAAIYNARCNIRLRTRIKKLLVNSGSDG